MYLILINLINTETGKVTQVRHLDNVDSVRIARTKAVRDVAEFNGKSIECDSPMRQELVSITNYTW